jgi:hypothetical protein
MEKLFRRRLVPDWMQLSSVKTYNFLEFSRISLFRYPIHLFDFHSSAYLRSYSDEPHLLEDKSLKDDRDKMKNMSNEAERLKRGENPFSL